MQEYRRPGARKISSVKLWDNAIAVNLTAPMLLSQRVARRLIDTNKPGRIINMVSIYAGVASSVYRLSAYCATKAGLANLTRQLAVEWAPHNILVNAIAPGWIPDRSDRRRHREERATKSGWKCSRRSANWDSRKMCAAR